MMGKLCSFSDERYHGVKFGLSSGTLTVSSPSPEMGEASETIDVEFGGDEFSIGFNASYAYTDGVLEVTVEKLPESKPVKIHVN
jgi:DNA polymerase III sliding clamp (beta) subunit (PCNA family)